MAKQFQFQDDARAKLMEGIDTLSKAVGVTLGPKGRNVMLDQEFGPPRVCSDGVTIAKEIELAEPFQNIGVQLIKVASSKTNDSVGDGTTTSTVLAQSMVREGFKNIAAGANPMSLRNGMDKAVNALKEQISDMSIAVDTKEQISQIATLAAHDEEMGNLIADLIDDVGREGIISIEESKGLAYEVERVEGMEIDRGYLSPYFVTNQDRMIAEIEEPRILLTAEKISSVANLVPLLEKLSVVTRNLVIIGEDVDGEALATLVVNKMRGNLNCVAIKAPGFGDRRKAIMEDMAILFGATVISSDIGRDLESATIDDLGKCRKVTVTKDDTTFVDGGGNADAIKARIENIRSQSQDTSSDYDREKLEERAAKLSGGVAVIRVGASTEPELREKKQRLEDALSATRAAMDEGIVPGGGTSLVRAAQAVRSSLQSDGDERVGTNLVLTAVEYPVILIAENAGVSGQVVLDSVKQGEGGWGYDADAEKFGDMIEMGIIDPAKVTRSALENAASVAGMILTTELLITELNPPKLPAPYND